MTIPRWEVRDEHICEDGDFVLYADHRAVLADWVQRTAALWNDCEDRIFALRAENLRLREIVTTGVTWTNKHTGKEETFCPGCGTILDDRGWLCPDGCRIAQIRKEEVPHAE